MKKPRPLIGLTAAYSNENDYSWLKSNYYEAISRAGGAPVLLPPAFDDSSFPDLIERCDGILIAGGPDIDPVHFGEPNKVYNGEISPLRDKLELFAARKAVEMDKPLLGICRGIQVINTALGGTLYQDIYAQIKQNEVLQHSQKAPNWYTTHDIAIEKDSHVYTSLKKTKARVNSFHHQAVKDPAPGFCVTSRSQDGIIESIENNSLKFAVGVQWHPECLWEKNSEHLGIFKLFIQHCTVPKIY